MILSASKEGDWDLNKEVNIESVHRLHTVIM